MSLRRRTRRLKTTAFESLVLAVEHFNRPSRLARSAGVLLPLQHALEMLLKASIFESRGTLYARGARISFSFAECVRICASDLGLLGENDVTAAAMIDAHRDACQHYGSELRETSLYVDAMTGVTLFRDVLDRSFGEQLGDTPAFSGRTLPVAVEPPREFQAMVATDFQYLTGLLAPGHRRRAEALAVLRPYVLTDRAVTDGEALTQPTDAELERLAGRLAGGEDRLTLLPGLARLGFDDTTSITYELRITKNENAAPVRIVRAADPDSVSAAAVLEYNILDRYPFYAKDLAAHAGINRYDALAVIYHANMKADRTLFRQIQTGSQLHDRYSHRALALVRRYVAQAEISSARAAYSARQRAQRNAGVRA